MAIPILNHLDLRSVSELRNAILHKTTDSSASNVEGKIIYDTGANKIKFYDGSQWQTLGTSDATGDIEGVVAGTGLSGGATSGTATLNIDISEFSAVTPASGDSFLTLDSDGSTEQLTTVSALQTYMQNNLTFTTDTNLTEEEVEDFVGGMLGGTETGITVTYQDSTGDIDFVVADTTVAGDSGSTGITPGDTLTIAGGTNVTTAMSGDTLTITATDTNTQLSTEQVQDIVGAMFTGNTETRITATYQDGDGTIDLVVNDMTANDNDDVSNANLLTALANLESSGGASNENITIGTDSGDTIVITGNLQVSGTTTTVNSTTVNLNDHNIVLDSGNSTSAVIDGAGITLEGGSGDDATFTYNASTNAFDFKLGSSFEDIKAAKFTGTELDISGDVDIDGTLEADAITVNGSTLQVVVEDHVGAMLDGTETGISVSYDSSNNNLDFVVSDTTVAGDSGSTGITPGDTLTIAGGSNVTTSMSGDTLTIAATDTNTQLSIASAAEVQTGTNNTKAVSPDSLAAKSVHATIDVSDSNFTSNLYAEITHSLGTEDVIVQLFDSSSKEQVYADVARTDKSDSASTSKIKVSFAAAPSNDIEVLITSIKGSTAGSVAYN
tara:strand:+ start:60 stop:1892 length:1833 start_codon:yes stop_codon:yes gene_type:complete